jgi:hypothetical protein
LFFFSLATIKAKSPALLQRGGSVPLGSRAKLPAVSIDDANVLHLLDDDKYISEDDDNQLPDSAGELIVLMASMN